jgi:hypothetical protein
MSAKQLALEFIQNLSDDATWKDIVASLQEARETEKALGRYDKRGGIPDEDLTDEEWMAAINRAWAEDLNDPRQDIYTLEDGTPSHESR